MWHNNRQVWKPESTAECFRVWSDWNEYSELHVVKTWTERKQWHNCDFTQSTCCSVHSDSHNNIRTWPFSAASCSGPTDSSGTPWSHGSVCISLLCNAVQVTPTYKLWRKHLDIHVESHLVPGVLFCLLSFTFSLCVSVFSYFVRIKTSLLNKFSP